MRRRRWAHNQEPEDLNVTAFLNLMVVLVPFLLVMAVFSRITIIEVDVPRNSPQAQASTPDLDLEVLVRQDRLVLAERVSGEVREIANRGGAYDLGTLAEHLQAFKGAHPDITNATLLLEPDVPYEQLIAVMDTVRTLSVQQDGDWVQAELFPDIAVGEAPGPRS